MKNAPPRRQPALAQSVRPCSMPVRSSLSLGKTCDVDIQLQALRPGFGHWVGQWICFARLLLQLRSMVLSLTRVARET
eukprot:6486142-Amphidinium_carterae.1